MDMSFEQMVRERAYEIWMAAGMADGMAHEHWCAAEKDLMPVIAKPKAVRAKATASKAPPVKAKAPKAVEAAPAKTVAVKAARKPVRAAKKSSVVSATLN